MKSRPVTLLVTTASLLGVSVAPTLKAAPAAAATTPIPLLRVGVDFPESTLDQTKNSYANFVTSLALEDLSQFGPNGQLEPDLAPHGRSQTPSHMSTTCVMGLSSGTATP